LICKLSINICKISIHQKIKMKREQKRKCKSEPQSLIASLPRNKQVMELKLQIKGKRKYITILKKTD
ncbi:MAG: hypothetical protein Q8731_02220, partial [Candidatus Phytoplasma australasiaticum]|nr:hypothetical protein [Candidatus Phytoplasma australasiaticum]